jgi:Circularly permutated YpsA SLOG family
MHINLLINGGYVIIAYRIKAENSEQSMKKIFSRIISGGQTGVDRAALDVALELGLPAGGWCPRGRRAEDGPIDLKYPLQETRSPSYPVRTEKNVLEAEGTLILTRGKPKGGTALTIKLARFHKKPYLVIDLNKGDDKKGVWEWAKGNRVAVLNVAGPRETEAPGIYEQAFGFLKEVLSENNRQTTLGQTCMGIGIDF